MVRSGRNQDSALKKFNGRVLGVLWDPSEDVITMHMGVNLSPKKQKIRQGPELTLETIGALDDAPLMRRIIASQVSGIYDPMGLCCPVTIRFKMLLQEIVISGTDWDEPLEPELDKKAREALREIVKSRDIIFHRSTVPKGALGDPEIVGFWDGGRPASAGCLYVRYYMGGGRWECRLLAAKARVTPSMDTKVSTPGTSCGDSWR